MKGRDLVQWFKDRPAVTIPLATFVLGLVLGAVVF